MSILAIIQARTNAERLPGKVLEPLAGVPMIEHVIARVKAAEYVTDVCVAIPDGEADDALAAHLAGLDVDVFRGDEDDVLGRFYWCAERYPSANPIVRITADDPFKDPELIDYAILGFMAAWAEPEEDRPCHYLHLGGITWPLGLDVEVFSRDALTLAHQGAVKPEEREHVTPHMARLWNPWVLKNPNEHGNINMRWTVDTWDDLEFARQVYTHLYDSDPLFGYERMRAEGY